MKETEYNGYYITEGLLKDRITVLYQGDEIVFDTIEEAKQFIDEINTL